eukprot:Nitzschia sp. Nitz4//scaffold5_size260463//210113//210796//NITZ4_001015-RA/size260463-exonerate_est2genome-gene-0.139-mRNA-1//1//CDS//3329555439//4199//frame0
MKRQHISTATFLFRLRIVVSIPASTTLRRLEMEMADEEQEVLNQDNCKAMSLSRDSPETQTNGSKPDLSYCVVWSPLFPITLFLPFIGHTGITDSRGIANDFQGSYYVGTSGDMAFGPPTRYLHLETGRALGAERWNEGIAEANQVYSHRVHNLCCDNCHSHVCHALNRMAISYEGDPFFVEIHKWDMVKLCFLMFFRGKFIGLNGFLCQFLPTAIMIALICLLTKR